jgi:uncharacterized protein YbjT (DUF2867 family)
MSQPILVTGGSGTLGRVVVAKLAEAGKRPCVLSRRPAPADSPHLWATADLLSGEGVAEAVAGAGVVIHCATPGMSMKKEIAAVGTVVEAARRAGCPHLVYVSIVGVDRVPFGYYKGKVAAERLVERCGVPYTILRATQFHDLLRVLFAGAARLPVMPVPGLPFQPVDVRDVADRLVELALDAPAGRAADVAGPQVRQAADLARAYLTATGRRRPIAPVRLPGALFRAFRQGRHLAPDHAVGRITFESYLAGHPAPASLSYRGGRR